MLELRRAGYRIAYRLLWLLALVRPPRGHGAKALLRCRGEVLLVRHTYGPDRWEMPGGGVRRSEEPLAALRRELAEELGLELADATELAALRGRGRLRRHTTHLYLADVEEPALRPDPVEIAELRWCDPTAPPRPLAALVREALARLPASASF